MRSSFHFVHLPTVPIECRGALNEKRRFSALTGGSCNLSQPERNYFSLPIHSQQATSSSFCGTIGSLTQLWEKWLMGFDHLSNCLFHLQSYTTHGLWEYPKEFRITQTNKSFCRGMIMKWNSVLLGRLDSFRHETAAICKSRFHDSMTIVNEQSTNASDLYNVQKPYCKSAEVS